MTAHDPAAHRDALVRLAAGMLATDPQERNGGQLHPDTIAARADAVYWSIINVVDSYHQPAPGHESVRTEDAR